MLFPHPLVSSELFFQFIRVFMFLELFCYNRCGPYCGKVIGVWLTKPTGLGNLKNEYIQFSWKSQTECLKLYFRSKGPTFLIYTCLISFKIDLLKWNISQPIINFFLSIHYPMNWKISPLDLAHTDECRKFANPVSSLEGFWRLFWELDWLLMLTPLWWLAMLLDLLLSMFSSSCYIYISLEVLD